MLPLFLDNFILIEATSSHFCRVTTSTQQLLFRGSYFFRTAAVLSFFTFSEQSFFRRSYFFKIASFSERKFYTAGTSWEQKVLYGSYFSEQLFFSEELFRIKISKKELLFQSRYFCTNLFRKGTFWKRLIFQKINFRITYFFWRAVFLEQLLFRKTLPSIAATFSKELLFYNIVFQNSYYFTAMVPFHSYTSYLFISH